MSPECYWGYLQCGLQLPCVGFGCRQQSMDMLERRAVEADSAAAAAARVQQPVKSSEIKAKQTVRDLGVFTAFEDGRIRVRFADRTIVAVDRWHRFVEVVHRDGTTGTVSVRPLQAPSSSSALVFCAMQGAIMLSAVVWCCWPTLVG